MPDGCWPTAAPSGGHVANWPPGPALPPALKISTVRECSRDKLAELGGRLVTDPDYQKPTDTRRRRSHCVTVCVAATAVLVGLHSGRRLARWLSHGRSWREPTRPDLRRAMFRHAHIRRPPRSRYRRWKYTTRALVRAASMNTGTFLVRALQSTTAIEVTHIGGRFMGRPSHKSFPDGPIASTFHDTMSSRLRCFCQSTANTQCRDHQLTVRRRSPRTRRRSRRERSVFSAHDVRKGQDQTGDLITGTASSQTRQAP